MSLAMNAAFREDVINMYLNGQMHRNKTEKDEKGKTVLVWELGESVMDTKRLKY